MKRSLAISVVIPTLDRPKDLSELLSSLWSQSQPALEIVVIDDSKDNLTTSLVQKSTPEFASIGTKLVYLRGDGSGNTSARNQGIAASSGDAILFLDDDTLLEKNVIQGLAEFLRDHPLALGVQPKIPGFADYWAQPRFRIKLENRVNQAAMLSYHAPNMLSVRRSGAAVFPSEVTAVVSAQRMMGCSFCIRRSVLSEFSFDTNLKKWGCYDDLDLTYRIYRKYPGSLFVIPTVAVIHKHSSKSRLPSRPLNRMTTIYWFYIFFKDLSDGSLLNSLAFLWAMGGALFWTVEGAFVNHEGRRLTPTRYLIRDYLESLWHLRSIRKGHLDFFNRTLG